MQVAPDVFRYVDTVNVHLVRSGREAIAIDFGSGDVLDHLGEFGIDRLTDVLLTHHHRDVTQGLGRARAAGARIWAPATERDLIAAADEHWQMRPIDNVYDLREDRFTILDDVPVDGSAPEYVPTTFGGVEIVAIPTPGHTPGSVSYFVERGDRRLAFTGDLIAAPGKVWSLAATQWTYTGIEGLGSTILGALDVLDHLPDVILPAHGAPIDDPEAAVRLLVDRLQALIDLRSPEWQLEQLRARPYLEISRHLLRNRTSISNSYVLLSDTGNALVLDYGYDFTTGLPAGSDRSSRRPWLQTIPVLRRDHGVDRVEVALPTHYHDDHVAGFNLLRDVEGTAVWAAENMVDLLQEPRRFDLPCLWYDPISVDRSIPYGEPIQWHEYELTLHPLPGHTLFAAAIEFEVDGQRVIATGDQQDGRWVAGERPEFLNYEYRNGFRFDDFIDSALLYRRLRPDLLISGHWLPRPVTDEYLDHLLEVGQEVARLHRELLPLDEVDFGAGGFGARIEPYQSWVGPRDTVDAQVTVRNPFGRAGEADVAMVVPAGWSAEPAMRRVEMAARGEAALRFRIQVGASPVRRARIAADLTVCGVRFGQQAEALVTVR